MTDTLRCGHCGKPITTADFGFVGGATLCHTGTLPPSADPADCYRLVTVYGHRADGECCQTTESTTPLTPATAPALPCPKCGHDDVSIAYCDGGEVRSYAIIMNVSVTVIWSE